MERCVPAHRMYIYLIPLSVYVCASGASLSPSWLRRRRAYRYGWKAVMAITFYTAANPLMALWGLCISSSTNNTMLTLAQAHTYTQIFYDKKCAVHVSPRFRTCHVWRLLVSCIIKGQFAVCTFSRCHQLFRIKVLAEFCIILIVVGWGYRVIFSTPCFRPICSSILKKLLD